MALLLGRRLRRRAAAGLALLLVLYVTFRVDYCLRCLYSQGFERPKCHNVYSRAAILGGPVVCMERHWSRAMHRPLPPPGSKSVAGSITGGSIMRTFAFDRAVAAGLRSPSDEMAEIGINRTWLAEQGRAKQRAATARDWPLLPANTVDPPAPAAAAGLRRIEPTFTFAAAGAGAASGGATGAEEAEGAAAAAAAAAPPPPPEWPEACSQLRYGLYIPHHHSTTLPTTIAAVGSAMAFGASRIHIVDSSDDQSAASSPALSTLGVVVLQPARGIALPYALMHEYIRREAIAQEYDVYFYMHSDVTLGRGVVSEALRGLCVSTELHILTLC